MAVMVMTEFPGGTAEDAERWEPVVRGLRRAPGFIVQVDGPIEGGWRLYSVWDRREDFQHFFDGNVKPNLPPGSVDRSRVHDLANVVLPERIAT